MPAFLSDFFFPSLHIFLYFQRLFPCEDVFVLHQLPWFISSLTFISFSAHFLLFSLLPIVAQSLKPLTTSWQLCVKGFVNPQGSNSAAQQWKSGGCSADVWDYSDPPQAMQGLQILTSSNVCRACTRRDIWQQLQREHWDSQRRTKWALVGPFLLTCSRLC